MNELNVSSYIQIMQSGFMTHDKQEAAGVFLLSSINDQEYVADHGYWTRAWCLDDNAPIF